MTQRRLPIATNTKRIAAFVIDDVVVNVLLLVVFYIPVQRITATWASIQEAVVRMYTYVLAHMYIIFFVKVSYHTVLIWLSDKTLRKYATNIKAVDFQSGQNLSFRQALWRVSARLASEMLFFLGFLFGSVSYLHQTLHDKLSDCVVIDA